MHARHFAPLVLATASLVLPATAHAQGAVPPVVQPLPVVQTPAGSQVAPMGAGDEAPVARLGRTLESLAEEQRKAQRVGSIVGVGVGAVVTTAGIILVARGNEVGEESRTSRGFVLGFGIGGLVAGGMGLFLPTPFERLRAAYQAEVGKGTTADGVLTTIERRWQEMADRERTGRMIGGTILAVSAAAGLGIGGYFVARDDTGGREANERRAAAALISAGFLASGAAFVFTTPGSSEAALRSYRDASGRPMTAAGGASLRLGGGPALGGGGVVTLGGAF